jgi:CRISPR system Cascade subunit CasB
MSDFSAVLNKKNEGHSDFMKVIRQWHAGLKDDRGNRAQLRRARTPFDVFVSPAYQRVLIARLREAGFSPDAGDMERLALGVGLLAHAKELTKDTHFAQAFAKLEKGSKDVRDVRFRRLLAVTKDERDELYAQLLRFIRLMDNTLEPQSLLQGTYWWNEQTKKDWAKAYYVHSEEKKEK